MCLMKANVRSFFSLNLCPPLDTNHTKTQYKNWERTVKMYLHFRSLVLTPHVDPAIAGNIEIFVLFSLPDKPGGISK